MYRIYVYTIMGQGGTVEANLTWWLQRECPTREAYVWYTEQYHSARLPPFHPSDALDHIARRLISTQAVRDS
jgi:hypothetical protein